MLVYNLFVEKSRDFTSNTGTWIISQDQYLANELYRPITRKFMKREVKRKVKPKCSLYRDNISGADLAD